MKKVSKKKRLTSEVMYTSVEAADLLGVTPRTIQIWADNGILPARKTSGGHRRFPESVLEAFIADTKRQGNGGQTKKQTTETDRFQILVAEDEPLLRNMYEATIHGWDLPIDLTLVSDGYETLIRFGTLSPDLLIADLKMPKVDGFQLIHAIVDSEHSPDTDIIVVTGLTDAEIEDHGGLPERVIVMHKPIPFSQLQQIIAGKIKKKFGTPA